MLTDMATLLLRSRPRYAPGSAWVAVALAALVAGVASGASPTGYAALVRRVAPSVVTVLVVEERVSAVNSCNGNATFSAAVSVP